MTAQQHEARYPVSIAGPRTFQFSYLLTALLVLWCGTIQTAHSQANQPEAVIFENVRIFNGTDQRAAA